MAFTNALGNLPGDSQFRPNTSAREDSSASLAFDSPISPIGTYSNRHSLQLTSGSDPRTAMHRRFTTNGLPTIPPIGQQRRPATDLQDMSSMAFHRAQLLEKKKAEYEYLREKRRKFEAQMELIDAQARQDEDEMQRLANELGLANGGHQSEPTTPPEHRESAFPSTLPRPNSNRFSAASLASPPIFSNRVSRTGSQMTSPPSEAKDPDGLFAGLTAPPDRSGLTMNRNSMPVTGLDVRGRGDLSDYEDVLGNLDRSFFLDEEDPKISKRQTLPAAPPDFRSYLHMDARDDQFPILVRRDGDGSMQLASASGMESSLPQSPGNDPSQLANGWPSKRSSHRYSLNGVPGSTGFDGYSSPHSLSGTQTPTKNAQNRLSMEMGMGSGGAKRLSMVGSPAPGAAAAPPKLLSSYSMNDVPTMKTNNGAVAPAAQNGTVNTHAEQHFLNHNATIGRIPAGKTNNRLSQEYLALNPPARQSQDFSVLGAPLEEDAAAKQALSHLQAGAAAFGPTASTAPQGPHNVHPSAAFGANAAQFSGAGLFNGYNVNMLNMAMGQMQLNGTPAWANSTAMYQPPQFNYNHVQPFTGPRENPNRGVPQRRPVGGDDNSRFNNVRLEDLQGEIYSLCKDQHGCRYLQKQLDDGNAEHLRLIFEETEPHVIDLMIDPFGNYLCQKLLEQASEDQRTALIRNASKDMVKIALNQHGTRALQKMIEYIKTDEQVSFITEALRDQVVQLIQDLNGNHVIQKCLNHLDPKHLDFIFVAVAQHCVTVGTHRHGCCVLQRCIDHASGVQKADLIGAITSQANDLVQDPFGNYVVQYILDQSEPKYSEPLCASFFGHVPVLSRQKFSSNVIEKCIRVSENETKKVLIHELIQPGELERLIRDSFANYVIQTAMDSADAETKHNLVEAIRPLLPQIRNTPYGRRIQMKIQERDNQMASTAPNPTMMPPTFENTGPHPPAMNMTHPNQAFPGYIPVAHPGFTPPAMANDMNRNFGPQPQYGFQPPPSMGVSPFPGQAPLFGSTRASSRQATLGSQF